MKKAIPFIFLLLANIIILAHTFVPHHHHDSIAVAIVNTFSADDEAVHNHGHGNNHIHTHSHDKANNTKAHDHSGHELSEECLLNAPYLRQNQVKQFSSADNDFSPVPDFIILFSLVPRININDYGELPFIQKPYLISYHTTYISQSLGLRAPPVC